MSKYFTDPEWKNIRSELEQDPARYGLPQRTYGSVILASFNIRKLGYAGNRNANTWEFLAHMCWHFDLIAVQEIMDDLSGLQKLMELLGPEFGWIVSDKTGVFPDDPGLGERLGFIFRWSVIQRADVVSDITYDRSKILETLHANKHAIIEAIETYDHKLKDYEEGRRKTKPKIKAPVFLSFIRQPFCVAFRIAGHPGTRPYEFMAINAHLIYGNYMSDREQEFKALMEWILARVKRNAKAYFPNFILMGDLNLNFDRPETDRSKIERYLKSFNDQAGEKVNVNFPFLDPHPDSSRHFLTPGSSTTQFRTNARFTETFDHIGLFFREKGLPDYKQNSDMGKNEDGPDYGVVNFVDLFCKATLNKSFTALSEEEMKTFFPRFEHKVSDHMPIWLRLPLPKK